ncbi:tetratricopeptide repeat protein, partial [Micromonospora echinofusca]
AGDVAGALADLATAHAALLGAGQVASARDTGVELAEAYRALGQPEQAGALVREALESGADGPWVARAARVQGLLCADAGDRAGAERHLRDAVQGYRGSGRRRELATTVLLLADHLERWDRPEEALDLLHDGLVEVERLGERTTVAFRSPEL